MKKLLWTLCFALPLYALESTSTLNIYTAILTSLSNKSEMTLYVTSRELSDILEEKFSLTDDPAEADVVIVDTSDALETLTRRLPKRGCKPVVFATSYRLLKRDGRVVGALYWKKGRSQLLFVKERLARCGIVLSDELKRYTVESL